MLSLQIDEQQLLDSLSQLSAHGRREAVRRLLPAAGELDHIIDRNRPRLEAIARQRGIEWSVLTEDERERLIDELLHEQD